MKFKFNKVYMLCASVASCILMSATVISASELPVQVPAAIESPVEMPIETPVETPAQTSAEVPVSADVTDMENKQAADASGPAVIIDDGKVSISDSSRTIRIGETFKLKLNNKAKGAVVKWTSSNEDIVTVGKDGSVHGISKGKAVVRALYNGKKYSCTVKVTNSGLDYAQYEIQKGETLRLHISGVSGKVKWSSDNSGVVKIAKKRDGHVCLKGMKKGAATVYAKSGKKTFACKIKVVKREKSVIYLTFDDGPSLTSTPKILDILKRNNVNATFFVINYDKKGEELIKREVAEGNEVAIHGYSHDYGAIYRSNETYISNVTKLQDKLEKTLGYKVWTTRFPGGSSNLVSRHYNRGIMSRLVKEVDKLGYSYFDWNVSSGDAGGSGTSAQVYKSVTHGLKKNRDNVVLMHDFSNNNKTIGALDSIIKYGKSHGYVFKTISDSTVPVHHGVQN